MRRLLLIAVAIALLALPGALRGDRASASATLPVAPAAPCGGEASVAQQVGHAGLVIVFPEGRVETRCVEFAGDSITGADLLRQSGLPVVFGGYGGLGSAVCRIDDVGCSDPGDCFCQCRGASCEYWSYFALEDGTWAYQAVGPAQRRLRDGDVDGWVWGNGRAGPGDLRAPCPLASPTPLPTPGVPPDTPAPANGGGQTIAPTVNASEATFTPSVSASTVAPTATRTPPPVHSRGQPPLKNDSGLPAGLIAFAALVAAMMLGLAGVVWWRRLGG